MKANMKMSALLKSEDSSTILPSGSCYVNFTGTGRNQPTTLLWRPYLLHALPTHLLKSKVVKSPASALKLKTLVQPVKQSELKRQSCPEPGSEIMRFNHQGKKTTTKKTTLWNEKIEYQGAMTKKCSLQTLSAIKVNVLTQFHTATIPRG